MYERRIQNYNLTVLSAIYHVVEHLRKHRQIILATKALTGEDLGFYAHLNPKKTQPPRPAPCPDTRSTGFSVYHASRASARELAIAPPALQNEPLMVTAPALSSDTG